MNYRAFRNYPFFFPLTFIYIIVFATLLLFLFLMLYMGLIGTAFEKLGIPPFLAWSILFLSVWGSMINIPIKVISEETVLSDEVVTFFGMRYIIPIIKEGRKVLLTVNVGGAVIPTFISLYLISRIGLNFNLILATLILTIVVNRLARPVKGVGIAMPAFIPPLSAAIIALVLAPGNSAPVAYISGVMGTLIGADIMNIGRIKGLGAPVVSIGGAGTFDGIFITGIIAVLLA